MKLLEILDSPLHYKIREDGNGNFVAVFFANMREYNVIIEELAQGNWSIDLTNEETGTELMHSGQNALRIYATTVVIIRDFMRTHKEDIQRIAITPRDERTKSLYVSLLKHEQLPEGWSVSIMGNSKETESILLINDHYNEGKHDV